MLRYNIVLHLLIYMFVSIDITNAQVPSVNFVNLTPEDGLSSKRVNCLLQDKEGFIWIGTTGGLNRYDGQTFKVYRHIPGDSTSLTFNNIKALHQDKEGIIWVGADYGGLHRFDPATETFKNYVHNADDPHSISVTRTSMVIMEDSQNNLWIGTDPGGICLLDREKDTFQCWKPGSGENQDIIAWQSNIVKAITEDDEDENILWLGTGCGLFQFNKTSHAFTKVSLDTEEETEECNAINDFYLNKDGTMWIATWHKSLYLFNKKTGESKNFEHRTEDINEHIVVRAIGYKSSDELWLASEERGFGIFNTSKGEYVFFKHNPRDKTTFARNQGAITLLKDRVGTLWIGHREGLSRIDPYNQSFNHVALSTELSNNVSLFRVLVTKPHPTEDKLFIGTVGGDGLYIMDRKNNTVRTVPYVSYSDKYVLTEEIADDPIQILDLLYSRTGKLWIVGLSGVFTYEERTGIIEPYISAEGKIVRENGITQSLLEDRNGNIWLGTNNNGLIKIDTGTDSVKYYKHDDHDPNSLTGNYNLYALAEDKFGKIWIGTPGGISVLEPVTEKFTNYYHDRNDPHGISDHVWSFGKDDKDNFWAISYMGGLNRINPALPFDQGIKKYTSNDGLPHGMYYGIAKDHHGTLWLGTEEGLCRFSPDSMQVKIFDTNDGLKFKDVYGVKALTTLPSGEIVIGIAGGITFFHPDSIPFNDTPPNAILKSIHISTSTDEREKIINTNEKIELTYKENTFIITFANLNYTQSDQNTYRYILEGFDNHWRTNSTGEAPYTKVRPGNYTFKMKAANNDGVWDEDGVSVKIVIHPPWWRSNMAYIFYLMTTIALIIGVYRFLLSRRMARAEAVRLKELDNVKTRLYTNITHEFRTPLTIILGLIDKMVEQPGDWLVKGGRMVKRNGRYLLNLVNQMLDLTKLESNSLPVHKVQGDIIPYLKYLLESFHTFTESKNILLHFLAESDSIHMDYDPEKTLKIVSNLLSNAIKFTPENGNIYLQVSRVEEKEKSRLQIRVKDTGIGIPEEKLPHIFDRFYQVDDSHTREGEGTGIGLALTRELVKLLEGSITVTSREGEGSVFTVTLPIEQYAEKVDNPNKETILDKILPFAAMTEKSKDLTISSNGEKKGQPLLLIIEDSADVVQYLYACLQDNYKLAVAKNGKIGIEKALELIPDIVISDIMMPEKDGFEVCNTLKNDERTSHIPIILLTAKADAESKIAGLQRGADAYLAKPFNPEELEVRLQQLIVLRQKLHERYKSMIPETVAEEAGQEMEDAFLLKVRGIIMENLTNTDLDVLHLARKLTLSRSQLFRKIKALTDRSPSVFIRTIRLQQAKKLLETTPLNVSEVAYETGFSDPTYFSKEFRKLFGEAPSVYREK